jgi:hypothetical protein
MLTVMRGLSSDIRYAFRALRHGGISTVVAILSLAVGVGANAAIFSVGYAMLARPLRYPRFGGRARSGVHRELLARAPRLWRRPNRRAPNGLVVRQDSYSLDTHLSHHALPFRKV